MYFAAVLGCQLQNKKDKRLIRRIIFMASQLNQCLCLNEHVKMSFIVVVKFPYSPVCQYLPF